MHYLGSDIRGKSPDELAYGKKAGAEIVGSYDAIRWVPEATVIPPGIDLERVKPAPPSQRRRPVVVHAPSSRRRKGTDHVVARMRRARRRAADRRGTAPRRGARALPRRGHRRRPAARRLVRRLRYRVHGARQAGRDVPPRGGDRANRDGVRRPRCRSSTPRPPRSRSGWPSSWRSGRTAGEIGRASRAYAERVHDLERVTDQLLDVYASSRAGPRPHATIAVPPPQPADLPAALPMGTTSSRPGCRRSRGSARPGARRSRGWPRSSAGSADTPPSTGSVDSSRGSSR